MSDFNHMNEPPATFLSMSVRNRLDISRVFAEVENLATLGGMGLLKRTQLKTATSELVTNAIKYAKGGVVEMRLTGSGPLRKIEVVVRDKGPGIEDIKLAMSGGYSTGNSLGIGLPGAKKLSDEFHIDTRVGEGTIVTIAKFV